MLIIQLAGMAFGLFMAYFTFIHFKRKEFGKSIFFLWEAIWLGLAAVVLFPKVLEPFVQMFSFARTLDFLITVALIIVITVSFFNYISVMKAKKKLEDFVRKIALDESKKEKKRK
jgi:hypothetical protein